MLRNSAVLIALLVAGCDAATVGNRTQRSGEVKVAIDDPLAANSAEAPEGVGAPMAWRTVPGAAFYGAGDEPPAFALRCDTMNNAVILERLGSGSALTLSVAGVSTSLAARDGGNGKVQARAGLDDAVLDAMSRSQSQIAVGGGRAEPVMIPGGIAIRRVVDTCRNPPVSEPAVEEAVEPENAVPPILSIPN